ncbi:hypothetical protein KUV85_01635 [Nocardioides panacisoli]|uniref:DUF5719 family protein n=1 Tax=Nocardioides panacisoli TaxID=627624 RepID=UPI001C62EC9A|nr:DUF5719 family protein [Nocardioides panacisoli]QYJ04405.1 hypothetical protein KUV85_01635 [Nocardioides panacisoli]
MTGRSAPRRLDPVIALAVLLPLLALLSVALLQPTAPEQTVTGPSSAALNRLSVACPTPVQRPAGDLQLTRGAGGGDGPVQLRVNRDDRLESRDRVRVDDGVTEAPDSGGAAVATGRGDAAPGLVAGRDEAGAVPECRSPWYDDWFVGAGATARQATVIELVNPDASAAVVNIDVHGPTGPIEDASWSGVTVPGNGVRWVRLAERPARRAIAAHVQVDQGRVRAFARHTFDRLGQGTATTDYLHAQQQPAEENLLLGVPTRGAQRSLFLANPGDDEVRATVRIVTEQSTLVPSGTERITVPPRAHVQFPLADLLDADAAEGALGLLVESTAPVVAGARGLVDRDLVAVGPATAYDEPMTAVVPTGQKTLIAGGASRTGVVRVTATAADGRTIWDGKRFEIAADQALRVELPDPAVRVQVVGRRTPVAATVLVDDRRGRGTVRLAPAPVEAEVPDVRPAR